MVPAELSVIPVIQAVIWDHNRSTLLDIAVLWHFPVEFVIDRFSIQVSKNTSYCTINVQFNIHVHFILLLVLNHGEL